MLDATSNCRYENLFMFTYEINDYVDIKTYSFILVMLKCEIIIFTKQTEQFFNNDEYLINLILYQ